MPFLTGFTLTPEDIYARKRATRVVKGWRDGVPVGSKKGQPRSQARSRKGRFVALPTASSRDRDIEWNYTTVALEPVEHTLPNGVKYRNYP